MTKPLIETSIDITGKHVLEFYSKAHRYKLDGEFITSTTDTKKGYPPSEQLIKYWIKQGMDEFESGKKLKKQASVGTLMHAYCHALRTNTPFNKNQIIGHPQEKQLQRRFNEVEEWVKERSNEKVIMAEKLAAMITRKVAGKFDVLVEVGGKLRLQDYKSAKGHFEDAFIQLGGYSLMIKEWYNLDVQELEVIRFNDNTEKPSPYLIGQHDIGDFQKQFLVCKDTRDFQKSWGALFTEKYKKENPWLKYK